MKVFKAKVFKAKMLKAATMNVLLMAIFSMGLSGCGKKSPLSLPESSLAASQTHDLSLHK